MIGELVVVVAVVLRLSGITTDAVATYRRTAKPNIVTWGFWMLTPLIAGIAQLLDDRDAAAWLTISYAIGPSLVLSIAFIRGGVVARLTRMDLAYLLSILAAVTALLSLGDWRFTSIAFATSVLCLDLTILTAALIRRSYTDAAAELEAVDEETVIRSAWA